MSSDSASREEEHSPRDRSPEEGPRRAAASPLFVVLDNLRSAYNVGSIFRTAEAARATRLDLCGITPYPPNEKLDRTALGAAHRVPWEHHIDTCAAVRALQAAGVPVWAVELTHDAVSCFGTRFPSPVALVFGHETAGIDPAVLALADRVVMIPMLGRKHSLNVATSFGIVTFEALRQWGVLSEA